MDIIVILFGFGMKKYDFYGKNFDFFANSHILVKI